MIILTYHKINNVVNFRKQVDYLVRMKYNLLSLQEFISRYEERSFKTNDVLITFDDGDCSVLNNALPVLIQYHCPAVLFVITGLIGTDQPFWWDEIVYYTNDPKQVNKAKGLPEDERLKFLDDIRSGSSRPPLKSRQLTLADLKLLEQNNVAIANHSHTHPMFDQLPISGIEREIQLSNAYLNMNGFSHSNIFAYPNGNEAPSSEKILKAHGIRFAFIFDHKLNLGYENAYRISRLSVNDYTPIQKYKFILSGWHSRILPLTKSLSGILRALRFG